MKKIFIVVAATFSVLLFSSTSQAKTIPEGYYEYTDPQWNFSINLPNGWDVLSRTDTGYGLYINSPDVILDCDGNPEMGYVIEVNIQGQPEQLVEEYVEELSKYNEIIRQEKYNLPKQMNTSLYGYNEAKYPFYDRIIKNGNFIYHFRSITSREKQDDLVGKVKAIFESISINDDPKIVQPKAIQLSELNFTFEPLLWPFEHGNGRIVQSPNEGTHSGSDRFALDLCEGDNCVTDGSYSSLGDQVLAPTNMAYRWACDSDNNGTEDYHILEVANNGTDRLCLTLGHFMWWQLPYGNNLVYPRGLALGPIIEYALDVDHIHMGLYTISSSHNCQENPAYRTPVEFIEEKEIEGVAYPSGGNYYNQSISSHNVGLYVCYSGGATSSQSTNATGCLGEADYVAPFGTITSPSNGSTISARTVTINANASDNEGGSGINKVEFRAYWPGSTYNVIGTDNSYPYSISWDMCNSNVPDGEVQLDIIVYDNWGNSYVYGEHNSRLQFVKSYSCGGGGGTGNCPTDSRDGVYFYADQNFSGDCYYSLTDIPNLGTTAVGNDRLSSVRIRGDYQVKIYEDTNYGGRHDELNNSDSNLDIRSLGDQYSSAKINEVFYACPTDGREGVYMYSQAGYTGDCLFSTTDIPYFGDTIIGDNDLDSIRFIGNWDAKLYEDAYYGGRYDYIGSNDSDLSDSSLGDQFSSAKLIHNTPAPTPTLPPNTTVLLSPTINNGGFETGTMAGWSTSGGSFVIDTMFPHSGSFYVKGTSATEAKFYRYFDLTSYQAAINESRVSSSYYVYVDPSGSEEYKYSVKFQDSAGNTLAQKNTGWAYHDGGYDQREGSMTVPVNTAKVLIEFSMRRSTGSFTDCDVDDFYLDITVSPATSPTPTPIPTATPAPDCLNTYPTRINLYDYSYCSQNAGTLPINITNTLFNLESSGWNDRISSLEIPDGWSILAYDGESGTGGWKCLTSSINSLDGLVYSDGALVNNSISSVIAYAERNCPQLSATNFSFSNNAVVGEEVTASFQVKNISGRTLTFEGILAGVHGPFCEEWDCPTISDFPWEENITIGYGETYTYTKTRSFNVESDQYLIEFLTYDTQGLWNSYQPTQPFSVSRGIEIIDPVRLDPPIPFVGLDTNATFTIKNFSNKTITLSNLMVIAKGPNCDSWECPDGWADFPWVHNIVLAPGEEYTYSQKRPFYKAGEGYFADAAYGDSNPWWYKIPNDIRYHFYVTEPIKLFLPYIKR